MRDVEISAFSAGSACRRPATKSPRAATVPAISSRRNTSTPSLATSPRSPKCSPAATATASIPGSEPPKPTTYPTCTLLPNGLKRDHASVLGGLTLPHSSGAVEGNVNRITMIKRQMYRRAKFDLLRKRVLLAT